MGNKRIKRIISCVLAGMMSVAIVFSSGNIRCTGKCTGGTGCTDAILL